MASTEMQVLEEGGVVQIRMSLNPASVQYLYSTRAFQALGYSFQSQINYDGEQPMDYWRAQLAFRGYSIRGSKVEALKARLKSANAIEMDPQVSAAKQKMRKE